MTVQSKLNLSQLNQMELQNLREIISGHQTMISKLNSYAQSCQDPQIKRMFQQGAQSAQTTVQNLTQSL
ncbi:hypothetical protein [Caldisalinibacter kiritimatiensis]|uniref:Spore coat protein n=1 Tax=Caldisalinibacter kiritimatiensis TaxID=1304284 RepID=R1CGX5_9FIRM|nr:hypothetical protein [Caldisalinibacter kiritimatiensis]EOD01550.1 hypothetical protein L21TH_0353 [Caldisalinibacter kiritimatiensis]